MKKQFFLIAIFFIVSSSLFSQTWGGSTTITGDAYRTGNVGIGTDTPLEALHINGAIRGSGTGGALKIRTDDGYVQLGPLNSAYAHIYTDMPRFIFNKIVSTVSGEFGSYYQSDLIFSTGVSYNTNGDVRMTILNSNGYVGIGTTEPSAMLTVQGKILADEIQIESVSNMADYVFETNYNLPSLEEVEEFVTTNKHLPELPTAKEFKEKGYNMVEMDNLLLKKVEELTLYIIDLKKDLDKKDAQIAKLQRQLTP